MLETIGEELNVDVLDAIQHAKDYVARVYADEGVTNLGVEETVRDDQRNGWMITVAFSRPWNTPRTRAQEVLENLGAASGQRRAYKTITVSGDGDVVSMTNYVRPETV